MKLTVTLIDDGKPREAIPVRSIPLVTDWYVSADLIALALAGADCSFRPGLTAHTLEADGSKAIPQADWPLIADSLHAIDASITPGLAGKHEWQLRSLAAIPSTAFVWADEFSDAYRIAFNRTDKLEDFAEEFLIATGEVRIPTVVIDEFQLIALEGFESAAKSTLSASAPTRSASEMPYGPERDEAIVSHLSELRARGVKAFQAKTAEKFGVSPTAIKQARKRHEQKTKLRPSPIANGSVAAQLKAANTSRKK